MEMHSTGIDRSDLAINTNAPFVYGCPLSLGEGLSLGPLAFLSVRLKCCTDSMPPARLGALSVPAGAENVVDVTFYDSAQDAIGTCRFQAASGSGVQPDQYLLALAFSPVGRVVGHSVCRRDAVAAMYTAAAAAGGALVTATSDFVLISECICPWFGGAMQAIEVDGHATQADVNIKPGPGTRMLAEASGMRMDLAGVYNSAPDRDGVLMLQIDNIGRINGVDVGKAGRDAINGTVSATPIWVGGRHVVIRHAQESNLRVTNGAAGVEIGGV